MRFDTGDSTRSTNLFFFCFLSRWPAAGGVVRHLRDTLGRANVLGGDHLRQMHRVVDGLLLGSEEPDMRGRQRHREEPDRIARDRVPADSGGFRRTRLHAFRVQRPQRPGVSSGLRGRKLFARTADRALAARRRHQRPRRRHRRNRVHRLPAAARLAGQTALGHRVFLRHFRPGPRDAAHRRPF